ncbi:peptidoglycan-binding protein [Streptomyces sp. NBC_00727]|uniref:peptidoglycan-binding domain-containing protein n=1 Tax=Streptomyces sp. NBC_00727 TaxID=2903675 RepID=UPI00386ABB6A
MQRKLQRIATGTTAIFALAAGSLALASPSTAASPASGTATVTAAVAAAGYNNLGLTSTQARGVQCFLNTSIYTNIAEDGHLGPASWKAMQSFLNRNWGQKLVVDGSPGPATIKGLQYFLKHGNWGYTGALDGIAGPGTKAAFARFGNATYKQFC